MKKIWICLFLCSGVLASLACQLTSLIPMDPAIPQTQTALAQLNELIIKAPTLTQEAGGTATVKASEAALQTAQVSTASAIAATRTQQAMQAGSTLTAAASTMTAAASTIEAATAAANQLATQQSGLVMEIVQRLVASGDLPSSDGAFHALKDFKEEWAQLNWYKWWETGFSPVNFAIAAHAKMTSASDKANWPDSGCGFVFAEKDGDNHNLAYLAMDGYVYVSGQHNNQWRTLAVKRYGRLPTPSSEADIALVVYNQRIFFFVNGQQVVSVTDRAMVTGDLNLSMFSGTNKDFGTRCEMTNIGLLVFK